MHAAEREQAILELVEQRGFIAFRELEKHVDTSPATLRRDLERMAGEGRLSRVRGGVKSTAPPKKRNLTPAHLSGIPFDENIARHRKEKEAIGRAAAALCEPYSA